MSEIETLRKFFAYDPMSGVITWAAGSHGRGGVILPGDEAGCVTAHGYRQIGIKGRQYLGHRLAWAFAHGSWPTGHIDHIDGDKANNRIANLRDVSASVNQQNQKRARVDNQSGSVVPGVYWNKGKRRFHVQAKLVGRKVHVGYFNSVSEAEEAAINFRRANYVGSTL